MSLEQRRGKAPDDRSPGRGLSRRYLHSVQARAHLGQTATGGVETSVATYGQLPSVAPDPPPPPPMFPLPTSLGIRPVIGPPLASSAGVPFVPLPPALGFACPQSFIGVTPCTWAEAAGATINTRSAANIIISTIRLIVLPLLWSSSRKRPGSSDPTGHTTLCGEKVSRALDDESSSLMNWISTRNPDQPHR